LSEMWGPAGFEYLNQIRLAEAYEIRLESLRDLIEVLDTEIRSLEAVTHRKLKDDHGYRTIQRLNGVGRVHAAVPDCGNQTSRPTGVGSPNKDRRWSAGRRWKQSLATTAAHPFRGLSIGSPTAEAATSPGWLPPESFSRSSTTGSETERSVACRRREGRTRSGCELARSADPTTRCGSTHVIEPSRLWPERSMPPPAMVRDEGMHRQPTRFASTHQDARSNAPVTNHPN
jgi:hypothetical protein